MIQGLALFDFDGTITGRFATPICQAIEKVNRINAILNMKEYSPINAYGNSSDDKPTLALEDHAYYMKFEKVI